MTPLTDEHMSILRCLAEQWRPIWGGVYDRGVDHDVDLLVARGLVEPVMKPLRQDKQTFSGGYRISDLGRIALNQKDKSDERTEAQG